MCTEEMSKQLFNVLVMYLSLLAILFSRGDQKNYGGELNAAERWSRRSKGPDKSRRQESRIHFRGRCMYLKARGHVFWGESNLIFLAVLILVAVGTITWIFEASDAVIFISFENTGLEAGRT